MLLSGAGLAVVLATGMVIAAAATPTVTSVPRYLSPLTHAVVPLESDALKVPRKPPVAPIVPTGRLIVPSAHLNARMLTMKVPSDGILVPPDFGDVFLVDGYGSPLDPQSGTVFVAMHASPAASDHAVGSKLQNAKGIPTVKDGAQIVLDGAGYTVTGYRIVRKGSLVDQKDLWNGSHDLVLITCSEVISQHRNHALDNALIFATREQK